MQSIRRHSVTILDYQQGFSVCFYLYQRKLNKNSGIYIENNFYAVISQDFYIILYLPN